MKEIEQRRAMAQAAGIAAASHAWNYSIKTAAIVKAAVVDATRVQIPDKVIDDLQIVSYAGGFHTRKALVEAALAALGFEVIKG